MCKPQRLITPAPVRLGHGTWSYPERSSWWPAPPASSARPGARAERGRRANWPLAGRDAAGWRSCAEEQDAPSARFEARGPGGLRERDRRPRRGPGRARRHRCDGGRAPPSGHGGPRLRAGAKGVRGQHLAPMALVRHRAAPHRAARRGDRRPRPSWPTTPPPAWAPTRRPRPPCRPTWQWFAASTAAPGSNVLDVRPPHMDIGLRGPVPQRHARPELPEPLEHHDVAAQGARPRCARASASWRGTSEAKELVSA